MCAAVSAEVKRIEIVVVHGHVKTDETEGSALQVPAKANVNDMAAQLDLSSPLDPRFKFDTFVVVNPTRWHMPLLHALLNAMCRLTRCLSMVVLVLAKRT